MKISLLLLIANVVLINIAFSQGAAINTSGAIADPSAMLDVSGTTSGVLINRLTEAQKQALPSPATGLMIYQTNGANPGFWYFNGAGWVQSIGVAGPTGTQGIQGLTGVQCIQGLTGANGAAGTNGVNGATVPTGVQGIQGLTGANGAAGTNGTNGPTDATGASGTNGVDGATGTTGPSGTAGSIPSGVIVMRSSSILSIPSVYALCDGTNGTPNLKDKFIVGAGSSYAVGATGDEATHVLTVSEMPAHTHDIARSASTSDGGIVYKGGTNTLTVATTSSAGGNAAHENRPPYYALAYIMKL